MALWSSHVDSFCPAIWSSFYLKLYCLALTQATEAIRVDVRLRTSKQVQRQSSMPLCYLFTKRGQDAVNAKPKHGASAPAAVCDPVNMLRDPLYTELVVAVRKIAIDASG